MSWDTDEALRRAQEEALRRQNDELQRQLDQQRETAADLARQQEIDRQARADSNPHHDGRRGYPEPDRPTDFEANPGGMQDREIRIDHDARIEEFDERDRLTAVWEATQAKIEDREIKIDHDARIDEFNERDRLTAIWEATQVKVVEREIEISPEGHVDNDPDRPTDFEANPGGMQDRESRIDHDALIEKFDERDRLAAVWEATQAKIENREIKIDHDARIDEFNERDRLTAIWEATQVKIEDREIKIDHDARIDEFNERDRLTAIWEATQVKIEDLECQRSDAARLADELRAFAEALPDPSEVPPVPDTVSAVDEAAGTSSDTDDYRAQVEQEIHKFVSGEPRESDPAEPQEAGTHYDRSDVEEEIRQAFAGPEETARRDFSAVSNDEIDDVVGGIEDRAESGKLRRLAARIDIDEPQAISNDGAWDDPANKQFMESVTNRATKSDLEDQTGYEPREPISLAEAFEKGPEAFRKAANEILERRFSEIEELAELTRQAREAMTSNLDDDERELANRLNSGIRYRIRNETSPEGELVAEALRVIGLDPKALGQTRNYGKRPKNN